MFQFGCNKHFWGFTISSPFSVITQSELMVVIIIIIISLKKLNKGERKISRKILGTRRLRTAINQDNRKNIESDTEDGTIEIFSGDVTPAKSINKKNIQPRLRTERREIRKKKGPQKRRYKGINLDIL